VLLNVGNSSFSSFYITVISHVFRKMSTDKRKRRKTIDKNPFASRRSNYRRMMFQSSREVENNSEISNSFYKADDSYFKSLDRNGGQNLFVRKPS